MTDRRSLERRLAEFESDAGTEDIEIIIRDTVVQTPWSADRDDREVPPAGTTQVRCYRDGSGAWTIEDGGEAHSIEEQATAVVRELERDE